MKTLTRQVEEMVDKKLRLASLAGHMIATLQINIERGYIVAVNDEEKKLNLADIMARWKQQYDEIENPPRPTIAELEQMLKEGKAKVTVQPDGSVTAQSSDET